MDGKVVESGTGSIPGSVPGQAGASWDREGVLVGIK